MRGEYIVVSEAGLVIWAPCERFDRERLARCIASSPWVPRMKVTLLPDSVIAQFAPGISVPAALHLFGDVMDEMH